MNAPTNDLLPMDAVMAAQRAVYGPVAEAQSLLELFETVDGVAQSEAFACLARGVMDRFVEAFGEYEHQLAKHGRLSTDAMYG